MCIFPCFKVMYLIIYYDFGAGMIINSFSKMDLQTTSVHFHSITQLAILINLLNWDLLSVRINTNTIMGFLWAT